MTTRKAKAKNKNKSKSKSKSKGIGKGKMRGFFASLRMTGEVNDEARAALMWGLGGGAEEEVGSGDAEE